MSMVESTTINSKAEILPLLAGKRPDGQLIYEDIQAEKLSRAEHYKVLQSPAFCQGFVKGDELRRLPAGRFEVTNYSGHVLVRVFSKFDMQPLVKQINQGFASLDGELEQQTARMAVFNIPIAAGFKAIEQVLDEAMAGQEDCSWLYGNIYNPEDGSPLNWWEAKPQDQ